MIQTLETPPIACVVPDGVFDAFGWCRSDGLVWRASSRFDRVAAVTATNPAHLAFVMKGPCDFLPRELARLHVPLLGLKEQWALAPYAIDDAVDELHARRVSPGSLFWLAADSYGALVWGLHDWSHFHNHGPFTQRAWTEFQCDATALSWLWINREKVMLSEADWERVRRELAGVCRARFEDEGLPYDDAWLGAERLRQLANEASSTP